ncbi:MAG: hypothetical protein ACI8WB_001240 [Phenylobacterium sp.]|jgi:hypothetical protein
MGIEVKQLTLNTSVSNQGTLQREKAEQGTKVGSRSDKSTDKCGPGQQGQAAVSGFHLQFLSCLGEIRER